MATITKSADAPSEVVSFSFGSTSFALDSDTAAYTTEDPAVVGEASRHPWLSVAEDQSEAVVEPLTFQPVVATEPAFEVAV